MSVLFAAMLLAADWKYITPAADAPMAHPPLLALDTSPRKPDDVKEDVQYRGTRRTYAQIRFGSPSSFRVTIVLDEISADEAVLYVDRNRERSIGETDRIAGPGPVWGFTLNALEAEGTVSVAHKREVVIRRGRQRGRLSMATVGYLEGTVELEGRRIACRRTDEDGNGRFGDSADRFHLDFDANGTFDPLTEQFAVSPIWARAGSRYAVHGDAWKGRLNFIPITGEGTLLLASPTLKPGAKVSALRAGLAGRDGTPAALAQNERLAAPPGEFRMDTLNLGLDGESDAPGWQFTFSYCGGPPPVWRTLRRDETLTLDPVGKPSFTVQVEAQDAAFRPGDELRVQIRLFTGDSLLINEARRTSDGRTVSQPDARVTLQTTDGRVLGEAHSGFA